jgi:hypothetical protein
MTGYSSATSICSPCMCSHSQPSASPALCPASLLTSSVWYHLLAVIFLFKVPHKPLFVFVRLEILPPLLRAKS